MAALELVHQKYLKAHESEYPFPLNGSDWARLVGVRKFFEHYPVLDGPQDFYVRLHRNSHGLLALQRTGIARALHYWFLIGRGRLMPQLTYTAEKTSQEIAWDELLKLSNDPELLVEAEKRWLEKQNSTYRFEHPEPGKFWHGTDSEMWESRPGISMEVPGSVPVLGKDSYLNPALPPLIEGDKIGANLGSSANVQEATK